MMQTIYSLSSLVIANKCDTKNRLNVNVAGQITSHTGIKNNPYRLDYYLIYLLDGSLILKNDNIQTILRKGQFVILSPFTHSSYHSPENENIDYLSLHFTGTEVEMLLESLNLKTSTVYTIGVRQGLTSYWDRFYREFIKNDCFFVQSVSAILTSTLILFSRYTTNNDIDPLSLNSITYINTNLHKELKVSTLAAMDNMSETNYRIIFKKITGMTPNNYITNKRIEAATNYLLDSRISLTEVARRVGYDGNLYYFERVFKKIIGVPPGKYRKSLL